MIIKKRHKMNRKDGRVVKQEFNQWPVGLICHSVFFVSFLSFFIYLFIYLFLFIFFFKCYFQFIWHVVTKHIQNCNAISVYICIATDTYVY